MAASTPSNSESPGAPAANDSPFQLPKNFYLPKTTIYDIMKTSLPQYAKTAVPARETVQSCVTEFIMFVTGEYVWKEREGRQKKRQTEIGFFERHFLDLY